MPVRRKDKRPTCPYALSSNPKDPSCWHSFLYHHLPLLPSPGATHMDIHCSGIGHTSQKGVGCIHRKKTDRWTQTETHSLSRGHTSCQNSGSQWWQRHLVEPETTLETRTSDRRPTLGLPPYSQCLPPPHIISNPHSFLMTLSHNPTQEGIPSGTKKASYQKSKPLTPTETPCWNRGHAGHQNYKSQKPEDPRENKYQRKKMHQIQTTLETETWM